MTRLSGARSAPPGHRPTWVEIDTAAITHNVRALKEHAQTRLLLAAVKANGYGHGMVATARAALDGGADWLGVATIEEGEELRDADIHAPVLLLNQPPPATIPALLRACVTPVVYTSEFVEALATHARMTGDGPFNVHLKLDTGMRRVGVPNDAWGRLLRQLADTPEVHVQGLMSHLAVADDVDNDFTSKQITRFEQGIAAARAAGLDPDILHLANSAATVSNPDTRYDMVRPGIAVYGLDPSGGSGPALDTLGLTPALTWWTQVALVKRVRAGEAIGYGHTWTAQSDTTIATLPVGYGDGLNRRLSNRGEVVIAGKRVPIVGRVSMDQILVEVPDSTQMGDEVAVIGQQGNTAVTADDWAGWLDTINYEVTTTITSRVPRVYLDA